MSKIYPAAKVILNDETLLDVTGTTATPTEIAKGFKIVSATGAEIEGTLKTQIFTCKIYNDPTIEDDVEETADWFINAEAAKTAIMTSDDFVLRDGDFLILLEYFSKGAGNVLTGEPARETYVYHIDDDTGVKSWITIGSTTMCDDYTITLVDGKVALMGADDIIFNDDNKDQEFIPYLALDSTTKNKMLKWVESSDILEKIHAIEQFFAQNPEMSEAIDTLIEVNNTLQELDNRIDVADSTLQELDNRIDAVDSTVPLICNWIAEFKGKTLVEFEANNYSDAINLTAFNRQPRIDEPFEITGITKDNRKIIFKAKVTGDVNEKNNIPFSKITTEPIVVMVGTEGAGTQAEIFNDYINNKATGEYSHAEGKATIATGNYSHAEGFKVSATGDYSHAEGYDTEASGFMSHAEGYQTTASGFEAHAEGLETVASEAAAHAEGSGTKANGYYAHAEGYLTEVDAATEAAHAEGCETKVYGSAAHAEGYGTIAKGGASHAEGEGTIAADEAQHVQGKCNIEDNSNTYAHIVGNGEPDFDGGDNHIRSNAHTLDWSGNAWFAGNVYVGSTSGTNKDAGSKKLATEEMVQTKTNEGLKNAKDYADSLAGNYDAAGGADDALEAAKAYTDEAKASINETITKITGGYEVEGNNLYELDQKISDINETISGFSYVEQEEFDVAIGNCVDNDSFNSTISSITGSAGGETTLASLQDAINNINSEEDGILAQAKTYTDELANGAVKTNTDAIASEAAAREEADNNLNQRLTTTNDCVTTHTQLIGDLNLTTQNMNAAIAGHTQSISDLSQGLDGLGNILEDNYYSKSEVDDLISNVNTPPNAPIATFASANELYNKCLNVFSEDGDIFNLGTWFLIENNTGKYQLFVVAKGEGLLIEDYDYVPTSGDVLMGNIETKVLTTGTYSHFSNYGGSEFTMHWRFYCSGEYEPIEDVVTRDENGDIIVPDFPTSGNAAIGWEYARTMMEEMSLQHRPAIIETTVDNNDKRDELLQSFIDNGYGGTELGGAYYGESALGPYGGDHVKITVTNTKLTHVYYYHYVKSKLQGDTKEWIEICQYYADLPSKLSSINKDLVAIKNTNAAQTTQLGKMESAINTISTFQSFFAAAKNCGGIEVIPASPQTQPYDFDFIPVVGVHVYYTGAIKIFYNAIEDIFYLIGHIYDKSSGKVTEKEDRSVISATELSQISGGELGFIVARAFVCY